MKIHAVSYLGLKGRSDEVPLGDANLIYGPNFTGKTTIIDAIKLALLGYHPSLDKTAKGVMELASGPELTVSVTLNGGASNYIIGNTWQERGGKITRKTFGPAPGTIPVMPVVTLDANEYFSRSDRGKVELIFASARLEGSKTFVTDTLAGVSACIPGPEGPEWSRRLCELAGKYPATAQEWLEGALNAAERARSEAAATAKRYQGTVQGTAALAADTPASMPELIESTLAGKRKALEQAIAKVAKLKQEDPTERVNAADRQSLEEAKAALREINARLTAKDTEYANAEQRWTRLLNHKDCPMCGTQGDVWRPGAVAMRDAELKRLDGERVPLNREKFHRQKFITDMTASLEKRGKRADSRHAKELETAELAVFELREEIKTLEASHRRALDVLAQEQSRDKAYRAWQQAEREEKNWKIVKGYLIDVKGKLVEQVFGPVLAAMRAFTDGILPNPIEFIDGDLGYHTRAGKWVPNRTFSGTEQALVFAAFQAAIGASGPVKLAIMDELGRIDAVNKERLLNNVLSAIGTGVIEQFIGIDTQRPAEWATDSFTLIERK